MAYIRGIEIAECRNVRGVTIDLAPADGRPFSHLILTGPNGSGKTSVVDALLASFTTGPGVDLNAKPISKVAIEGVGQRFGWMNWLPPELIVVFRAATRHQEIQRVDGPKGWHPRDVKPSERSSPMLLQYLVNLRAERNEVLVEDPSSTRAAEIDAWFGRFNDLLRQIFEDAAIELRYYRSPQYDFKVVRKDGFEFGLDQLAAGHAALLDIVSEILLRIEARRERSGVWGFDASGLVIVDEIDVHLHPSLQRTVLPFLTHLFPQMQFIVTTHSPAVIASLPDAVVYDLGTRTASRSADFRGIPYGSLVVDHFGLPSDIDADSGIKLARVRELAASTNRTGDEDAELRRLEAELVAASPVLATEVWWIRSRSRAAG